MKNYNVKVPLYSEPPSFDHRNTNKLVKFVPVKDKDILTFFWALPYYEKHFSTQPVDYLVQLIGHEGKNSLLSYLIK